MVPLSLPDHNCFCLSPLPLLSILQTCTTACPALCQGHGDKEELLSLSEQTHDREKLTRSGILGKKTNRLAGAQNQKEREAKWFLDLRQGKASKDVTSLEPKYLLESFGLLEMHFWPLECDGQACKNVQKWQEPSPYQPPQTKVSRGPGQMVKAKAL